MKKQLSLNKTENRLVYSNLKTDEFNQIIQNKLSLIKSKTGESIQVEKQSKTENQIKSKRGASVKIMNMMKTLASVTSCVSSGLVRRLWRSHGDGDKGDDVKNVSCSSLM